MSQPTPRRSFLAMSLAAGLTTATGLAAPALARGMTPIGLRCIHTGNSCQIDFSGIDAMTFTDVQAFRFATQDWRAGKTGKMDLRLLEFLAEIQTIHGLSGPFQLISGFRTQRTNRSLTGTARNSYHTVGRALDIRHAQMSTWNLRQAALATQRGGVGYYPNSHFVHIDTAAVRTW